MSEVPIFHGQIEADGKFVLDQSERLLRQKFFKTLAGKKVEIVVRRARTKRTDKQNKWWWGQAIPIIARELGYDKHEYDDLHYGLVAKCFGTKFDAVMKQEIPNVRSSQLSTVQFSELMEWVVRWAAQQDPPMLIPLPDEAESV